MAAPILVTKLFIPHTRAEIVQRPDLIAYLNTGLNRKLTLLSAPAGFGKTTLVSHWVEHLQYTGVINNQTIKVAWLSLDEDDNNLVRFLTYFITALNQNKEIAADLGQGALSMLQSPQPPPANTVLISLINELATISGKIIFILDDYHLIEAETIHQALVFLLENLPHQLHLVIATRQDPPWSLGRLRARDQLTELRAADLRFTSSEAADFLNRVMGLNLSLGDIAELETRSEGWIAGLQLAAISMQGRKDHTDFIKSFTGGQRLVVDFLIEEVLERQPADIRDFLLITAYLDRMNGALCGALTGKENSQEYLELLDNANLFIVPLDDERCWYRYHHLFRDLLRSRLQQTQPDRIVVSQQKASEWFAENGFVDEAIEYALHAEDFKRAIPLIEGVAETMWMEGEIKKLGNWLNALPEDLLSSKPDLCVFHAIGQHTLGLGDSAEWSLQTAERAIQPQSEDANDDFSNAQRKMLGRVAATRALIAFYKGNTTEIIQNANQALEYLPDEDLSWRSSAAIALADAQMLIGDLSEAQRTLLEALEISQASGNEYRVILVYCRLAITLRWRGQLQQVLDICSEQVQSIDTRSMVYPNATGLLLAIWGETLAETNDLNGALQKATEGMKLAECSGDVVSIGWNYICLVRIFFSIGNLSNAEEIVHMLKLTSQEYAIPPWIESIMAYWQVRIWLAQKDLGRASWWVEQRGFDPEKGFTHSNEMEYIALARIYMAQGRYSEVINLLQPLLKAEEEIGHGSRVVRVVEMSILIALAYQELHDIPQSLSVLKQVLNIAEASGYLRIFIDEAQPMARLLCEAFSRGIAPGYARKLLKAFPLDESEQAASTESKVDQSGLIEPLSDREIDVLQLLAKGLTNQVIATRLFLSVHTIKTHTRNIYGKLGVNNRTQAVERARTLGILPPSKPLSKSH